MTGTRLTENMNISSLSSYLLTTYIDRGCSYSHSEKKGYPLTYVVPSCHIVTSYKWDTPLSYVDHMVPILQTEKTGILPCTSVEHACFYSPGGKKRDTSLNYVDICLVEKEDSVVTSL